MFSFNGVSYNQSTGDTLDHRNPPGSAVGLEFSGGRVPVNTNPDWPNRRDTGTRGIAQNYTVTQQGVTADVSCQPIDRSQNSFTLNSTQTQIGPNITFIASDVIANCSGNTNAQPYFTVSSQYNVGIEGFLPVVVCPNPNLMTSDLYKFDVFMSGLGGYSFLPTTVCEVVPYLTTVNVTYNGGIISVDRIDASTSSPNFPLLPYIATVMAYQATTNQAMTTNPIGNFLTAYGANNISVMYSELEDYWRGIAEFASTQLRSGYSALGVPSDMTRPTNGTMYIMTYGWRSKAYTYILLLVVITVIWGATVLAAGFSLIQEKIHASDPSFDFSDPIQLAIVAYRGGYESRIQGDEKKGVYISEDTTVRFEGEGNDKRLVTVI
ncbi:hypothetical protein DFJ58DRAFT_815406 [Suillus subalutaceus]|uniref:uncharacterized protein n=1 Tax=Suillus subalutaceus TaxID=48586 RepID=UPI001B863891|nr:uncharacterized protein DFJ58DRAFT_815406 [Suillus subalutaceus]KAG1837653.1 hypothetical protein DFJ58DRAFT_815406 [Suillus subalutaceus]